MITIRRMTENDIEQVSEIENNTFSRPWSKEAFRESLEKEDSIYVVAKTDHTIAGYCGLWNIINEGNINNVAVAKQYRGQHIGLEMLTKLIDLGNEKKIEAYTLEVRESNAAAIQLYQRLGFQSEGIRKNFYEDPNEDAIIMWYRP